MTKAKTLFDKVWERHVVAIGPGNQSLLYIDRTFVHDGSFHSFEMLRHQNRSVRRPDLTYAMPDHYVPTRNRGAFITDDEVRNKIEQLDANAAAHGIVQFALSDKRQGIVHVVGPEQGLTLPGTTLVCGDSHTSTHGALGALAFGIGHSEITHVLASQTLWQKKPRLMRIWIDGRLPFGVFAKDLALGIIRTIGNAGAAGHALEFAGPAIRSLSIEGRLTLCNMAIEAGARAGMVAPDDVTFQYLYGRPYAPKGKQWDAALAYWKMLPSDDDATFDHEIKIDAEVLAPMVTWGTSPQDAIQITARIPEISAFDDPARQEAVKKALAYMGLSPGAAIEGLAIDRAFIGSCTNSRIEDLRVAASVIKGHKVVVPMLISPGSGLVKEAARVEGLDEIFKQAGAEWGDAGCSMCIGMNGDLVKSGERCASTSNRNFEGRQGAGARTHLMNPGMVAAAAVTGQLTDMRKMV